MEENCRNGLQFVPLVSNCISPNDSSALGALEYKKYNKNAESDGISQIPIATPHCMHLPEAPLNYVQYLSEAGCSDVSKLMSHSMLPQPDGPSLELKNNYQLEHYVKTHSEGNVTTKFASMEHPTVVQEQNRWGDSSFALQAYLGSVAAESKYPSKGRRKRSRERDYAVDRTRRLRISVALDALREIVPHPEEVSEIDFVDTAIEYVKNLQYQVKDLCRGRLGGESASNSYVLVEGQYGHYIVREHMVTGPLEGMIGNLINVYPSAFTELLQRRGLVVMPINFAQGLGDPVEMLNMQGKGSLPISK